MSSSRDDYKTALYVPPEYESNAQIAKDASSAIQNLKNTGNDDLISVLGLEPYHETESDI